VAVRWHLRYGLSYRDGEELLGERGVDVDHVTVYRWVQRFTPLFADAARFRPALAEGRWFVDETLSTSPVCGGTCIGPLTNTDRSSTYWCRGVATATRPAGSSAGR